MLPPLHCFSYCYQLYLFCAQKLSHTLRCVLFSHRPLCYLVSSCVISSSVCRLFFSFVSSFFLVPLFLRAVNCFLCDCSAHSVWLLPDFFCRFGQLYKSNFCFCYSHAHTLKHTNAKKMKKNHTNNGTTQKETICVQYNARIRHRAMNRGNCSMAWLPSIQPPRLQYIRTNASSHMKMNLLHTSLFRVQ